MGRIIAIVILTAFLSVAGQAQVVRQKLNQTFSIVGADSLALKLDGNITFRKTPGSRILVEISIELEGASQDMLSILSRSARYKLGYVFKGTTLVINRASADRADILVNGKKVEERISYKIYLPKKFWYMDPRKESGE